MRKGTTIIPLFVLLGILFLASASVSFGLSHDKCLQSCNREKNHAHKYRACQGRCNLIKNPDSEERQGRSEEQHQQPPRRERRGREEQEREGRQPWGRHQGEEEEEERDPREQPRPRHQEEEEEEEEREAWEEQPRRSHQEQEREGRRGRHEEEEEEEEEEPRKQRTQTQREHGRRGRGEEEGEEEEEEEERQPWRQRPQSQREREQERETGREPRREERQRKERRQHRDEREQREEREEEEEEGQGSQSRRQNNPFHFSSNRFQTRYRNRNGQIRVLQRFDQRSNKLQNLQNYRIVEYESRPNTLILPHHSDAEYILVVLKGRATITIVNPNDKQAYNLERGDALRLPAGNTSYLLNRDDNQNLRVVKLAIPVNKPGQFDDFFPSSTQNQQSYFQGFSRNTLEAAFNTPYEEIQRILLGEDQEQEEEQQRQEEGVIVRVSKEQIQKLSKHAQSSSRKGKPSKTGPFNLRSNKPIYSNKFGNFYEITPDKNPQLQDLELSLSSVEINEGAMMLPHYNSKAIEVVVVNKGKGNLELVGLRKQRQQQQQEQEEEGNRQVQRYRARLSEGDIFVVPAGHPISINASSNLHLLGFGINAENNQRNFLAGEDDNVISQLDSQVKELAFPGSAQDVERLINNQRQSYFANAQPQQREEGRRGPLSSILGAFY